MALNIIIIIIWLLNHSDRKSQSKFQNFLWFSFVTFVMNFLLDFFCRLLEIRWKLFAMHSSFLVSVGLMFYMFYVPAAL